MAKYAAFTVEYLLDDDEQEQLQLLLPAWQAYTNDAGEQPFAKWGIEQLFAALMNTGCKWTIADVLRRERERQAAGKEDT